MDTKNEYCPKCGRPIEDALQQRVEELEMNISALRSLNKRLVEDGERLAKNLTSWCDVYQLWSLDSEALEAHTALMKEIGG